MRIAIIKWTAIVLVLVIGYLVLGSCAAFISAM